MDSDDDQYGGAVNLIELWKPAVDAIHDATRDAFPSSPQGASRDEFQQYWHAIFTRLLETVAADSTIPGQLASPPVTEFVVNLFNHPHSMCCPCSMPDVSPTITLENEQGVSKMDLVRGMRDYLYGDTVPIINVLYDNDRESEERAVETPLVFAADWMSGGNNDKGERVSYYHDSPHVFIYCCRAGEFREMAQLEEPDSEGPEDGPEKEKPKGKARANL
jgi:hypothetical protein